MSRPVLYVLAGINGAGKSSLGGAALQRAGLAWYNPDAFARALVDAENPSSEPRWEQTAANAAAWNEGVRRLDFALANGQSHAFETTLGGQTMAGKIHAAALTHDVLMWFCGLRTVQLHLARVQARVAQGGHDIPEAIIRRRAVSAIQNVIMLMPHLAQLQIYGNFAHAALGAAIPDPILLAEMSASLLVWPSATNIAQLLRTPDRAKPLL